VRTQTTQLKRQKSNKNPVTTPSKGDLGTSMRAQLVVFFFAIFSRFELLFKPDVVYACAV
jgi:hypothetical protein